MERRHLLPGVSGEPRRPRVVFESARVIRRARRRAFFRDSCDILLLTCIDVFFVRWPYARVPFMTRHDSLELLVAMNAVVLAFMWVARAWPRWRALRVAGTWCPVERERLTASLKPRASRSAARG